MYSGEDSSGGDPLNSGNQFATWALSQAACSASKDNVDWAALAQQWIQMKESCSINNTTYDDNNDYNIPAAPPPPNISSSSSFRHSSFRDDEQGEAPMEVVKDDETFATSTSATTTTATNLSNATTGNDTMPFAPNPPEWQSTWFQSQAQFCPTWNTWGNPNAVQLQVPSQQISIPPPIPTINLLKDGSHIGSNLKLSENVSSTDMPMDAAKRKTLPAWIREGLEKMEREKLKQLEKNRDVSKMESRRDDEHDKQINIIENDIDEKKILLLQDNSDKSDYGEHEEETADGPSNNNTNTINKMEYVEKSMEERIEELMLIVRKSLTELLLEVTNEEILSIAQETFRKQRSKASSVQVFRKSALSSITSKLGLGAYADSGSDNSDNESDKSDKDAEDNYDSEEEIKENIRMRHDAFKLVAQSIEANCMESEEREYRRNMEKIDNKKDIQQQYTRGGMATAASTSSINGSPKKYINIGSGGGGGNNDCGETHPDKKIISNGKRIKERTSRFSSAKDSKYKTNFFPIPTSTANTSTTTVALSSSSSTSTSVSTMPSVNTTLSNVSSNEYDKRKINSITKQTSYSSDSSSSSNSSDSDRNRNRHRKSKSSRERHRDRDRDKNGGDRDKARSRDSRDREKDLDRIRHKEKDKFSSSKDKDKARLRDGSGGSKDRETDKNRDNKDKNREKHRDNKDRNRERSSRDHSNREKSSREHDNKIKDNKIKDYEKDKERDRDRQHKKNRNRRRHDSNRNSSDSDNYHSSRRSNRHRNSSYSNRDDRSRSNTRSHHDSPITHNTRSSRSRS